MSVLIKESDLPQELTAEAAVEAAYAAELAEVASKLQRGLPTLIECDKDLAPFLYLNVRNRLQAPSTCAALYLDGRPRAEEQPQGADADGHDRHHDRPAPRGRPRRRRAPRRRAAAPRPADHQPGRPDRRGARGHPAALREPGAGLARLQGPVVPAAAGHREPVPAPRQPARHRPPPAAPPGHAQARAASSAASSTRGRCTSTSPASTPSGCASCCRRWRARTTRPTRGRAYRQLRQATLGGTLEVPTIDLDRTSAATPRSRSGCAPRSSTCWRARSS